MQPQIYMGFSESRFQSFGSVRSPIQCEGIERGHRRIAEIAVCGSVNPQWFGSDALDALSARLSANPDESRARVRSLGSGRRRRRSRSRRVQSPQCPSPKR
jgi:hypothetical protein